MVQLTPVGGSSRVKFFTVFSFLLRAFPQPLATGMSVCEDGRVDAMGSFGLTLSSSSLSSEMTDAGTLSLSCTSVASPTDGMGMSPCGASSTAFSDVLSSPNADAIVLRLSEFSDLRDRALSLTLLAPCFRAPAVCEWHVRRLTPYNSPVSWVSPAPVVSLSGSIYFWHILSLSCRPGNHWTCLVFAVRL